MAPSDLKRFTEYLSNLASTRVVKEEANVEPVRAADTDFDVTQQLLTKFERDERLQNVLMDTTGSALITCLDSVQQRLREVEAKSIAAYIQESRPLNELHNQIKGCDGMLGKVEGRLGHFDEELSAVNREIQSLEEDSENLSVMLRNRTQAAETLGKWLEDTTVPPGLISAVREGDVTDAEAYSTTLRELRNKAVNMQAFVGHETLQAYPTLQALQVTAADRAKSLLLERIHGIKPSTAAAGASNATVRRQALLAFREYAAFVRDFAPRHYRAIAARYIEDSGMYLNVTVKTYMAGLAGVTLRKEKVALVQAGELGGGSRFGSMMASTFLPGGNALEELKELELGTRPEELIHPDFSLWPAAALKAASREERSVHLYRPLALQAVGKNKIGIEYAFKALLHQMCDAAAGEYVFLESFFGSEASSIFDSCWTPVLAMVRAELDSKLATCYDVLSILLMTRIVGHCQLQMTHAHVPVLDAFLDGLGLMLWPHFSRLIREHIESVTVDKSNAKAVALKPPTPDVLPFVRRWSTLFCSVARLNAEYGDSQIHNNLDELANALHSLLYRIRLLFLKPLEGQVFHIVNLHHIVATCRAADASPLRTQLSSELLPSVSGGLGDDAVAIVRTLEESLDLAKGQYREECLASHVQGLLMYLGRAEEAVKAPSAETAAMLSDANKARKIMQDFKDRWKQMVTIIRQEVFQQFMVSEPCQNEMTRACLEELYRRYKDFLGVLAAQGEEVRAVAKEGPSLQTLAYELREIMR